MQEVWNQVRKMHLLKCQQKSHRKNNDILQILHTYVSLNSKNKEISVSFNEEISVSFNEGHCWNKGKEKRSTLHCECCRGQEVHFPFPDPSARWDLAFLQSPLPQHGSLLMWLLYGACCMAGLAGQYHEQFYLRMPCWPTTACNLKGFCWGLGIC